MYIHKHLLAKYLWMLLRRVHSDFGDLEKGCLRWFWQAISETSYPGVEGGLKIDNHHMVWSTYQKSHQNFSTNRRQTVVKYEVIISNECDNWLVFSSRSAFLKSPTRFVPKWRGSNLQSSRCCDCKEHSANNGQRQQAKVANYGTTHLRCAGAEIQIHSRTRDISTLPNLCDLDFLHGWGAFLFSVVLWGVVGCYFQYFWVY